MRDAVAALAALSGRAVNYDENEAPEPGHPGSWHVDHHRASICREAPGPPVPGGAWEVACALVRDYEFADPGVIRAFYRADQPLLGRDMLLEGRFCGLRLYMGVRVTEVIDENREGRRVWGWAYQTLEGHLEQGKLRYEVVKTLDTGEVALDLRAYSRRAPIANPVLRVGFDVFGRRMQLRFYRAVGERLRRSVRAVPAGARPPRPAQTPDGLVMAPAGVNRRALDRLGIDSPHPGA